jgi:hypothetical protein
MRETEKGFPLCPGLPASIMGRVFGPRNLWVAQVSTTVVYHRPGPCLLTTLHFDKAVGVKVQRGEQVIYTGYGTSHSFELSQYVPYEVRLMIKEESKAER